VNITIYSSKILLRSIVDFNNVLQTGGRLMAGEIFGTTIGINGCGRMGKGMLRLAIAQRLFPKIVLNFGREVGCGLEDIIQHIMNDTTYGNLAIFCNGINGGDFPAEIIDEKAGIISINGVRIHVKRAHRNPVRIDWEDAAAVVDTTGRYNNPNTKINTKDGSVRGHLDHPSVKKALISSPFKGIENGIPADASMMIKGVNDELYNPNQHNIISGGSCTTTCAAYMMQLLLLKFGVGNLQCFELQAVHADTGKQPALDRVPAESAVDPVHFQSTDNNLFVSSTGADKALGIVIPTLKGVSSVAKSIRVPTQTSSLVILTTDWSIGQNKILTSEELNASFAIAAHNQEGFLKYVHRKTTGKNILASQAATTVQGADTEALFWNIGGDKYLQKVVMYGWYDNEFGYVRMFTELLKKIVAGL
jgi:glyceraldehyde 3-phosphate dehydrogenase